MKDVLSVANHEMHLAQRCFGYGRWDAKYWFIGPEQGQARWEGDRLDTRCRAFEKLQSDGLCDCKSFHIEIGESRYFEAQSARRKVALQSSWRRLMLTLLAFKDKLPADRKDAQLVLRQYQATQWGSDSGETCVVELSGLPANSLSTVRDRDTYREQRLRTIHDKMLSTPPEFVVIYGKSQHQHWRSFWARNSVRFAGSELGVKIGLTKIAFANQPTAPGQIDSAWIELGQNLQ